MVYADVDLNLIDGSAVWLASLTEMLSKESNLNVNVLLKRSLDDDKLVRQLLAVPNVRFIDPWSDIGNATVKRFLSHLNHKSLDTESAANIIKSLLILKHVI